MSYIESHPPIIVEDYTVPRLVDGIEMRNQQIFDLENRLGDVVSMKHLNEEDNLRLRRFITDVQYHYDSTLKSREYEIERLTGRVMYLEEELFNLQRKPQNVIIGQMKDSYDPQRLRDLERMLALKDEELDQLRRQYRNLQDRADLMQNEATKRERNRIVFEQDAKSLPFVLENDDLKKQNAELKRQLEVLNGELNHQKTLANVANAELEKLRRKLREYEQIEKLRAEKEEDFKRQLEPVYIKVSEDQNLLDGLLGLIHYVRESVCDVIFEIFIRSANQAHVRKMSSTIIFTINVKELKERNVRGFIIVMYLYKKMKQFVKLYFPYYGKIGLTDEIAKMTLGAQSANDPCHFRDNINQWLEQNVTLVMQQYKKGKKEPNKEYFHLYRLLALRYRIKYPIKGDKPLKVDLDVKVRLENKICVSLLKLFIEN